MGPGRAFLTVGTCGTAGTLRRPIRPPERLTAVAARIGRYKKLTRPTLEAVLAGYYIAAGLTQGREPYASARAKCLKTGEAFKLNLALTL
jgi:hypothetical protein